MDIENRDTNLRPIAVSTPGKISKALAGTPSRAATAPNSMTKANRVPFTPSSPSCSVSSCIGSASREAARVAKLQNTSEKIERVAELKEKWAKEKLEKAQRNKTRRENELKRLQDASKLAALMRQVNLQKQRESESAQKDSEKEMLASSLEDRAHVAAELKRREKQRRKKSILLNKKILTQAREKEQQISTETSNQEHENLELRRLDTLQVREAKMADEQRRRESMAMRGKIFQLQKQAAGHMADAQAEEEAGNLEFRKTAWEDDRATKEANRQKKRQSMAGRIEEWRRQRKVVETVEAAATEQEHVFTEYREQDWRDVEEYKQKQAERDRQSMAGRLTKWREEKEVEAGLKSEQQEAAEYEAELQQQAFEDMRLYENRQKESRRQSLAYRLDKARSDKDYEAGQRAREEVLREEDVRLAALTRADVQAYQQSLQDARRQSLAYRNQVESHERMRLAGEQQNALNKEIADSELREQCWRDVKEHQAKNRESARKSLAARLVQSRKHHMQNLENHRNALEQMHDELESKRQGWIDVQNNEFVEKQKGRKSIAMRLDSWRLQRMAEEKLKAKKMQEQEEDARLREQDREALLEAQSQAKEETRLAVLSRAAMAN